MIRRDLLGMPMFLSIPIGIFRGLALCLVDSPSGALYELRLIHPDAELSIVLASLEDEADAVRDWSRLSKYFGLPPLVERQVGEFEPADPQGLGPIRGHPKRRRSAALRKRRGRFALRRKLGRCERLRLSFADEREIVSYE